MWCSDSEGCSPPAPTVTVTSNHCPRFTASGAASFGVCLGSKLLRTSLNSGVNCSSWPARGASGSASSTPRPTTIAANARMGCLLGVSGLGQDLANLGQELAWAVGLGQIGGGPGVLGPLLVATERERGDHDDGHRRRARIVLQLAGGFQARDLRELDVHQDQIGRRLAGRGHPGLAVVRLAQAIGGL